MGKATAIAHPNKALVLYWGKKDQEFFLPTRSSLSLTLEGIDKPLDYFVTVDASDKYKKDIVTIEGKRIPKNLSDEFIRHVNMIRRFTGISTRVKIDAKSTFPIGAGLAGSAARAAALGKAVVEAYEVEVDKKTLSTYIRVGSGSGTRSTFGGWVHWKRGTRHEDSYAEQLYDENYWDVRNIIAVVEPKKKKVPSRLGMQTSVETCPKKLYDFYTEVSEQRIEKIKEGLKEKDFDSIGLEYERENILFREVCLETTPPLNYWSSGTHIVFSVIKELQEDGNSVYGGTDAGPNVHILTLPKYETKVIHKLEELKRINILNKYIKTRPGRGVTLSDDHLF